MPFATQTREVALLMNLFRRLKQPKGAKNDALLEHMVDPQAVVRTATGASTGSKAVLDYLRQMQAVKLHVEIVAPKGGLITLLVSPMGAIAAPHEQVYRIANDRLVELIDLGRSPDLVKRPESQPS